MAIIFPLRIAARKCLSAIASCVLAIGGLLGLQAAFAHSVGQVQTTKFFAPETIQYLKDKVTSGSAAGFQVGDVVTYIIQFNPIANGAITGVAGYITDYIPAGTEVVGADIVAKDGAGNYYPVAPSLPGGIDFGTGNRAATTFLTPFATAAYDPTGRCAAGGFTNNCQGSIAEVYADTGVFYSTDARTTQFPPAPLRIQQSVNGYQVAPTAANALNLILGQTVATTHNLWDADQTNAFGSTAAAIAALAGPKSAVAPVKAAAPIGQGNAPFYAGSAVAGPQTGYQLDNSAQVGPWQRIAYPGSRIGSSSAQPVTVAGISNTAVNGDVTSLGYNLSLANPLPSGTNAVRWAVGKLVVGQISYVRLKLRVTQPVGLDGITNASEVFGGDAGDGDAGQDNTWRYHVPSVADNNSNLFIQKEPCNYDPTATTCTPLLGTIYPGNSTITYRITYFNSGNAVQNTVSITDYTPCQVALGASVKVGAITGPLAALVTVPYVTTTVAGDCALTPQKRHTITFPTITNLAAADGGLIILNIPNTANTANDDVINIAKMTSAKVPSGITSNAVTFVGATTGSPVLLLNKSTAVGTSTAGGTVQYTVVLQNVGTGTATTVTTADILPSNGGAANAQTRFNFGTVTSIASSGLTTVTALVVNTNTSALFTPIISPYDTAAYAANSVQVRWNFGIGSKLVVGGVITITFTATVGSQVLAQPTPYYNSAVAVAGTISTTVLPDYRVDVASVAGVSVAGALAVSKTLECYYSGGVCVPPSGSGNIPQNPQLRYKITYQNTSASTIPTVTLADILPCQASVATGSVTVTVTAVTGPIGVPGTAIAASSGNCPSLFSTVVLGTASSLAGFQTGSVSVEMLLRTPATTSTVATNIAKLGADPSSGLGTATAQVQNSVISQAQLLLTKTANPASVTNNGTVVYTITVSNVGTTAAQTITVYDWLPTLAAGTYTVPDAAKRFNYQTPSTPIFTGITGTPTSLLVPPSQAPYSLGVYAGNQQELRWFFGAQTLAVGASFSIVYTATVGAAVPLAVPPNYYYNYAQVRHASNQSASANVGTNVSAVANLSISKTNGISSIGSGQTTSYTVTVANAGPSNADGAVVKDFASAGLSCNTVTCTATGGTPASTCPAGLPSNFFGIGVPIPTFSANSSVVFVVSCDVLANGQ